VYVISKIEPSFTKTYQEMQALLESELKTNLANDQIYELKNKVEDALAGGATLAEIAKEHHFKVQAIDSVSKSGKNIESKDVLPEVGKAELLDQIFSLAEKSDSPVIDTKGGISYVVHVDKVQPAHVPPFKDIKAKVLKAWTQNKHLELGGLVAQQLAKDARSVSDLSRLAISRKLPIKMLDPLSRADSERDEKIHKQFTPRMVSQMFELTSGKAIFGVMPDRESGIQVVMLQKVLPFNQKPLQEKWEHMEKKLSELVHQDASALYVKSLREKATVSVNEGIYSALVNRG
jgi:peptidyl-prolyl cis-trans isomerase D